MMEEEAPKVGLAQDVTRKWQYVLDKLSPHVLYRWIMFGTMLSFYCLRVWIVNGWYIVTYGLGIYLLNQLIGFLSPQFDPEDENFDSTLPTRNSDEYRPFARRLPEFKFWHSCMGSVLMSFAMTFFEIFDIPVFWPILLLYFFVLFFITMKRQIAHMIKHRYIPFDFGKPQHSGKPREKESK